MALARPAVVRPQWTVRRRGHSLRSRAARTPCGCIGSPATRARGPGSSRYSSERSRKGEGDELLLEGGPAAPRAVVVVARLQRERALPRQRHRRIREQRQHFPALAERAGDGAPRAEPPVEQCCLTAKVRENALFVALVLDLLGDQRDGWRDTHAGQDLDGNGPAEVVDVDLGHIVQRVAVGALLVDRK